MSRETLQSLRMVPLAVEGTDEAYVKAVEENTKKLKGSGFPDLCHPGLASRESCLFLYQP